MYRSVLAGAEELNLSKPVRAISQAQSLHTAHIWQSAPEEPSSHAPLPAAIITFTQASESYKTAYVMARIHIADIDHQTAPRIRRSIVGKIEQFKANVIIDLAQVNTIATAALASFLEFKYLLATHQRCLLLAAPQTEIVRALRITRMDSLLTCTTSIEAAIQTLAE